MHQKKMLSLYFGFPVLNLVTRFTLILFSALIFLSACQFDKHYLEDVTFPGVLTINNLTEKKIYVYVYSTTEAKGGFVSDKMKINSGRGRSINMTYETLEIFKSSHYVIEVKCKKNNITDGKGFSSKITDHAVTINIHSCPLSDHAVAP